MQSFVGVCLLGYLIGSVPAIWVIDLLKPIVRIRVRPFKRLGRGPRLRLVRGTLAVRRSVTALERAKQYLPFLLINFSKGVLAVILARALVGTGPCMMSAGLGAIAGHSWPLFERFRTERGVAVALGATLALSWGCFTFLALCFVIAYATTRYSLLSLTVSFIFLPVYAYVVVRRDTIFLFSLITSAMVIGQLIGPLYLIWSGKARRLMVSRDGTGLSPEVTAGAHGARRLARRRFKLRLAIGIISGLMILLWFSMTYVYRGFGNQASVVRAGNRHKPVVAITFDDGPDPLYTPQILKVLKQYDVKATFFMLGKHVQAYPQVAREVVAEGHEIGSHSYSHPNMVLLSPRSQLKELQLAETAITTVTGKKPKYFRPPRGLYDRYIREYLERNGYTLVLWSLSSEDWIEPNPIEIKRRIERLARGGDIILFHDSGSILQAQGGSRASTVRSLPLVIEALRARGFEIVPLSELLESGQESSASGE